MIRKMIMLFAVTLLVVGCADDLDVNPITYEYAYGLKLTDRSIKVTTCGVYPTVDCQDSTLKDSSICKNPVDSVWFKPEWILVDFLDENLEPIDSLSEVYYGGALTRRNFYQNYWHVGLVGEWMRVHVGADSLPDTTRALDTLDRYVDILLNENIKVCMDDELAFERIAELAGNGKYSLDVAEYMVKNEQKKLYGDSARLFFTDDENLVARFR